MSNLAIKEVSFNGDNLLACQEYESNKIYVGVSFICGGIGLTEKQRDRQVSNIQTDLVLKQGVKKLPLKFEGQVRNVLCIELDFLPLWLAKISITPKMQEDQPFIVKKLIEYQLKAKDVLSDAFIKNNQLSPQLQFLQGVLDQMKSTELKVLQLETKQNNLEQQSKETQDNVIKMKEYLTESPDFKKLENAINVYSRRQGINQGEARTLLYKKIEDLHGIDIQQLIKNKHKKMNEEREQQGKKPYAESTLKGKYNGTNVLIDKDLLKAAMEIMAGLTS